ncbi:MAG: protein-glutamate O-methyltransferase CheR [Gammaproteobacteria bacterium]|nr:protein-glutamate O-methyltransferase CheR [Gammaproteobacteria bacterium]
MSASPPSNERDRQPAKPPAGPPPAAPPPPGRGEQGGRPAERVSGDAAYARFTAFLERHVGITLGATKDYLVNSRLAPVLATWGLPDLPAVVDALERRQDEALRAAVVDAMTTNETNWFRDTYPFRYLGEALFGELFARRRPIRIWSAACSSGQEAYSMAMLVHEYRTVRPADNATPVDIVATDVSGAVLRQARAGVYDALGGVRGLSPERLTRYFDRTPAGYELKPVIRNRVSFREFNLLGDPALLGQFDVVFLRNVLIYFSVETRARLLARIRRQMQPKGVLVVGASEAIPERELGLTMVKLPDGVIYRRGE